MLAKLKGAAQQVVTQNSVVAATREPRKTLSLVRKKKEEITEKGLKGDPFMLAAANGRIDVIKSYLKADDNYPVNAKFGDVEETALHYAAFYGHLNVVKELCSFPCDPFATNKLHENALHVACASGSFEVVDFLTGWVREKPLKTYEERKKHMKYLQARAENRQHQLDAGVPEIDVVESDEEIDPEWEDEHADEAEEALINAETNHRNTPIMRAARKGHLKIIDLLCQQGADVSIANHFSETALTIAINNHHTASAVRLIDAGSDKEHRNKAGWTPLMIAAGNGDVESVKTLVKRGCNVNADTKNGMTALVVARARGCNPTGNPKSDEICQILLDAGALEKEALMEQKVIWAKEEEERRNRPTTAEDRPQTSEQRRREQSKIRVL
jgi:ankyrin repeat protein